MKRDLVSCNNVQLEYITYGDGKERGWASWSWDKQKTLNLSQKIEK